MKNNKSVHLNGLPATITISYILLITFNIAIATYNCYIKSFTLQTFMDRLIEFYPLLFLPLFIKKNGTKLKKHDILTISLIIICYIAGKYTGYLHIYSLFQLILALYLVRFAGITIHPAGFLLLICIPFFTDKYSLLFGFSLRILLTRLAGTILHIFDPELIVRGNIIIFKHMRFAVDPPCSGLNMFIALLVMLTVLYYTIFNRNSFSLMTMLKSLILIIISAAAWLASNLVRIIILIIVNIPAESSWHELTGLLLFIVMTVIPVFILYRLLFKVIPKKNPTTPLRSYPSMTKALIIITAVTILHFIPMARTQPHTKTPVSIAGFYLDEQYKTDPSQYDILNYTGPTGSIIIKRDLTPLRILHHPHQCWVGSGYTITTENTASIKNMGKVKKAKLNKEGKTYNLYWWYHPLQKDNNKRIKTRAIEGVWRFYAFITGTRFIQVNLCIEETTNIELLMDEIKNAHIETLF